MATTRQPLRYFGSKWLLAEWIISFFPPHEHYVEPFCGGASVFFRKPPSIIETINDSDEEVVNFFRVLRDTPESLLRAIRLTPYARWEHKQSMAAPAGNRLEQARRFYVRAQMSFGGHQRTSTGWRYVTDSHDRGSRVVREWRNLTSLEGIIDRLRQAQIECEDALNVIARYDSPQTLFYVDPPYVLSSRSDSRLRYVDEMTDEDHRGLARVLHQVRGMVVLSGYTSPLYAELFAGWARFERPSMTNAKSQATESLWLSPRAAHSVLPLFPGGF